MKALKTIVATAVVALALATVATAGVQHYVTDAGQSAARAQPSAAPGAAHVTVTLTDRQLGRLVHSLVREQLRDRLHDLAQARAHDRRQDRHHADQQGVHTARTAIHRATATSGSGSGSFGYDSTPCRTDTTHHGQGGSGPHGDGGHDGGCD